MDVPNLSGGPAVTPPNEAPKSKLGLFAALLVVVAVIAGGYYYFAGSSVDAPPSLEAQSKATQGFIKAKGIEFLVPTAEDAGKFTAKAKKFVTDKVEPTPLNLTKNNKGMHYIYWDGATGASASFQEVIENANPTKARMLFVASWNTAKGYFDTTPHNYYVKEKEGRTITKVAEIDQLKNLPVKQSAGVIFAAAASTEIYGFNDGNTFASKAYGICDKNTPNGWNLFASHTKSAKDLLRDCKNGQVKAFHYQTSVDGVKFQKGDGTETLKYSMVWVNKGDEVVVSTGGDTGGSTGGDTGGDKTPEMKDHKYTVEGDILKVQFVGTTEDKLYVIDKDSNLVIESAKGYGTAENYNPDDTYVKVFTSDKKYLGSVEFKNTTAKEFSFKLEEGYKTKYTFTIKDNKISLKAVPVEDSKKTDDTAPAKATWVTPNAGAELSLATVKASGLTFVASDSNTKSHQKIDGNYAMNYHFKLDGPGVTWSTDWTNNLPSGDTAKCKKDTSLGQKNVWACPYGTVPASAFASATGGEYTLSIEVGDGKAGSGWSDVKFNIKAAEVKPDPNAPKKCSEKDGQGVEKEVQCQKDTNLLLSGNTLTVKWKLGGEDKYTFDIKPSDAKLVLEASPEDPSLKNAVIIYSNDENIIFATVVGEADSKKLTLKSQMIDKEFNHFEISLDGSTIKGELITTYDDKMAAEAKAKAEAEAAKKAVQNQDIKGYLDTLDANEDVGSYTQNTYSGDYSFAWKLAPANKNNLSTISGAAFNLKVTVSNPEADYSPKEVSYKLELTNGVLKISDNDPSYVAKVDDVDTSQITVPHSIPFSIKTLPVYVASAEDKKAWKEYDVKFEILDLEGKVLKTITKTGTVKMPDLRLYTDADSIHIANNGDGLFPKNLWINNMYIWAYTKKNFSGDDGGKTLATIGHDDGWNLSKLSKVKGELSDREHNPVSPGERRFVYADDYDDGTDMVEATDIKSLRIIYNPNTSSSKVFHQLGAGGTYYGVQYDDYVMKLNN